MDIASILFGLFFIVLIARVTYQLIKKKRFPTVNYQPFDDAMSGIDPEEKHNNQVLRDTKHEKNYEERTSRSD
ncbi:hypothetical protein KD050_00425 [Psychrobacillus sp. INOP01]|uniref:hypothetical protein n=1 Tax=Psychrobacillus sp. INOP01 TaxID=2829187 RepID=UPI001BAE4E3A|nr:hypothetical protein [Psychrobacillus sp. INOP01]QUG41805.1 hypothetical protein KD050_00425 [Psychrobacillus sp. INOP01]